MTEDQAGADCVAEVHSEQQGHCGREDYASTKTGEWPRKPAPGRHQTAIQ